MAETCSRNIRTKERTKDRLKKNLKQLSAAVAEETGRPLVFIIDELDRCRPTSPSNFWSGSSISSTCPAWSLYSASTGRRSASRCNRSTARSTPTLPAPLFRHRVFAACHRCRSVLQKFDEGVSTGGVFSALEGVGVTGRILVSTQTVPGVSGPLCSLRPFS